MRSILSSKLALPKEQMSKVLNRFLVALGLLFIPVAQFYSALVAFPLFMHPSINTASPYMEYTFGYFIPKSPVTVAIFAIYYFVVFYIIEPFRLIRTSSKMKE